mgnify:CR=1 FL=1
MEKAVVVRGNMTDPRRVDLDEPVDGMNGPVEVVLRPVAHAGPGAHDVFEMGAALFGGEGRGVISRS